MKIRIEVEIDSFSDLGFAYKKAKEEYDYLQYSLDDFANSIKLVGINITRDGLKAVFEFSSTKITTLCINERAIEYQQIEAMKSFKEAIDKLSSMIDWSKQKQKSDESFEGLKKAYPDFLNTLNLLENKDVNPKQ